MKKILLGLVLSLIPAIAYCQGVSVSGTAIVNTTTSVSGIPGNSVLQAVPNAQIDVCSSAGGGVPCSPHVTIYSNVALTVVASNPLTADANGNFSFFVPPNATGYVYSQTGSGIVGQLFTIAPQSTSVTSLNATNLVGPGTVTGAYTHSGTETFANINAELFVCPSAGCLYQTILAAYNALPSCTITPTPVNASGGAGTSVTVPCGTIHVAPGSYPTPPSTVIINSSFVRIMGSGPFTTILNCSTACYEISGASSWGGTASAYPGGFYDVDIEGGGSAITGLLYLDGTGLQLHRVRIAGFSGTGGQGLMLQNDTNAYSERENFEDVILDNNKVCLRMDAPNVGLVDLSMGHQNWIGLKFQLNNGQTALKMTGGAQLFSDVITGVLNTYPPNTNTYTGIDLTGLNANGILQGGFAIVVDNGGAGTFTACSGCTTSNFKPWGWNSINNSQFYTTNAGPVADTSTAGTFGTGYCWSVSAVVRACLDTDGGGGLHFVTASNAWLTLDPSGNGGIMFLGGSTSGSVGLQPQPVASGTVNFPNGPDTLVGRATTDSLTNKTFSGITPFPGNTAALTADWTCGTGGTVSSCTSATIIGSGGGVPLTFPLPSVAQSYTLECDGWVSQTTALTANQWNLLTATNGASNVSAYYAFPVNGATAPTLASSTYTIDQASTTTTFQIGGNWTLGALVGVAKYPFHILAKIEGASASGTTVSLQLLAPTVGDLVTIYRGTACRIF